MKKFKLKLSVLILLAVIISACSTQGKKPNQANTDDTKTSVTNLKGMHLLENCRVYNQDGIVIKNILNDGICYLNDDGSALVTDTDKTLSLFDANCKLIWKI